MNRQNFLTALMISVALGSGAAAQQAAKPAPRSPIPKSYKDLKYPPLNDIKVPEPARFELSNGMVVYLVEDHELPTVTISAMIRSGSRWEPIARAGVASITGSVMRTGGTATRSGDQLDEELDRLAAVVETSIGEDSGRAMVSVLKEDLDRGLSILADVLQHPAFPQDKIDLAKIQQRDRIARRNDDASGIAFREFRRLIFGKDTPYGHQPEYDTLNSIAREDLVAFHQQYFQPENVILGAWGDFQAADMRARIEKALGGWARGGRQKPPAPPVDPAASSRAGLYQISKEDVTQSWVLMGYLGGKRNHPDYYALTVMNDILGGGFASRLFSNVRSAQGLAYAVGSNWNAGWDRPGTFTALGSTKTETTVKILESIRHELRTMAEAGATDDELARAKDSILKGFAFEFDSTGEIVQRLVSYDYYGYPLDYLQQYRANIEKVTKADVARVAKQYVKTDQLAILVLGKEKGFDQPLSSLGPVTAIDIAIPKPKEEALAAATPEATARGKAILAKVRDAMGGPALKAIKEYTSVATLVLSTPQGEFSMKQGATHNLSGKMLSKIQTPMGEIVSGYDGQAGWMKTPQGVRDLPASEQAEVAGTFFRDTVSLLQNFESGALTVQSLGTDDGVAVEDPARKLQVKLYVDPATNLLVKKSYTAALMGAPGAIDEIYSDYREAGGVKFPHKVVLNREGKKIGEQTVTEIKINPGLDDSAYKKPTAP
ncbi:MAG: pitrilysin family protein [Acidobacteriota bacterium]